MNPVGAVLNRLIILIFYVCLYPVGGGLTAATGTLVFTMLGGVASEAEDSRRWGLALVIAMVVAFFTIKTTARAEQFFAGSRVYQKLRYLVRLFTLWFVGFSGITVYIEGNHPGSDVSYFERMLADPVLTLIPIGFVVFMVWLLRGGRARDAWHEFLGNYDIDPFPPAGDSAPP